MCADNASVERLYLSSAEHPRGSINVTARFARNKEAPRQTLPQSSAHSTFDGSQARKSFRPGQKRLGSVLTSAPTVDRPCPTLCETRLTTGYLLDYWRTQALSRSMFTCMSARRRIGTYFLQRGHNMKRHPGYSNSFGFCNKNPMPDQALS